jgi:hypothetical protein
MEISLSDSPELINIRKLSESDPIGISFANTPNSKTLRICWYTNKDNDYTFTEFLISENGIEDIIRKR